MWVEYTTKHHVALHGDGVGYFVMGFVMGVGFSVMVGQLFMKLALKESLRAT